MQEKKKRKYRPTSETRQIIFTKAIELMSVQGFQGTTVRDICAAAEIPIGTFYNCYKTKLDILNVILSQGDAYFHQTVAEKIQGGSAAEQMTIYAECYAQLTVDTGIDVARVLYNPVNGWFAQNRPMQEVLVDIIRRGQEAGEIRGDWTPEEICDYIFVIFRGTCYTWCVRNGDFPLREKMVQYMQYGIQSMFLDKK